jgi:hypothetical protein
MSPQQDVSVRDLLAAGPAVTAICTPPDAEAADARDAADEPERDEASADDDDLRPERRRLP